MAHIFEITIGKEVYKYNSYTIKQIKKNIRPLRRLMDGLERESNALVTELRNAVKQEDKDNILTRLEKNEDEILGCTVDMVTLALSTQNDQFKYNTDEEKMALRAILEENLHLDEMDEIVKNASNPDTSNFR